MSSATTHPDNTPTSSNGFPSPNQAESNNGFRKLKPYLWAGGAFTAACAALIVFFLLRAAIREPFNGATWEVAKQKLRVTIVERGSLESAENSDIICRVKAKSQGNTIASAIKWVIDDGTQVKAGEPIMYLDDSGFQEQLKNQRNIVNEASAKWVEAKTNYISQDAQNEKDIKSAEVELHKAILNLKKFVGLVPGAKIMPFETPEQLHKYLQEGFHPDVDKELAKAGDKLPSEYLRTVSDLRGKIETARSDRETWFDRASWSQQMVRKGYFSPSQADADQSRLAKAEIDLRKEQATLDIYYRFDLELTTTNLWSEVKEKERALKLVKIQAPSKLEKVKEDEKAKKAIYFQEQDRLEDMQKEEKHYKIASPQDGMVVYYVPEQSRSGGGTQQSIIAQGEPVREGQKLMRIPNLQKMLVNARVHEAMVSKVRGEKSITTGYGESLRAGLTLGRQDLFGLASFQLAFEEIRDKFKDRESTVVYAGQQAAIRVDAHPGKQYKGHVKTVATVASQADFFSSDIKVYQTMVSIDDAVENLKPGMSAEVTILADESTEAVVVIPIQSVVGNVAMGAKRKCYVVDASGFPKERDIEVGISNDRLVEVKRGLEVGEKVVLNPRSLIPEKSDMKPGTPGSRRGVDFEEGGGKKGKKGDGMKGQKGQIPDGGPTFQKRSGGSPSATIERSEGKKG